MKNLIQRQNLKITIQNTNSCWQLSTAICNVRGRGTMQRVDRTEQSMQVLIGNDQQVVKVFMNERQGIQ